ncbi:MAG TPA: hypothetical protein ENN17_08115, partial [bacterium]|nr:hypothetical protein [bacterium]
MNPHTLNCRIFVLCFFTNVFAQAPPAHWSSTGIGGGGALFCPVFSPHDADECYVSCDMGALYHTTNLGLTWEPVHFQEISAGGLSQLFFTADPHVLYVLQYLGWGYMPAKSTDGGRTWVTLDDFPDDREAFYLFADYNNPNRLLVSSWSRLYLSDDGGRSFFSRFSTSDDAGILLAGVYFDGKDIHAATNLGMLVSNDDGRSFVLCEPEGIPDGQGMISFDAAKSGDCVRFWCTAGDRRALWGGITGGAGWELCAGIYSFDLGAESWRNRTGNIRLDRDFPFFISCADNDTSTAYLAGGNSSGMPSVLKTTDSGNSWNPVFLTDRNQNIHTGWQGHRGDVDYWWGGYALGFTAANNDVDKLAITDLGFIHMSTDGGKTWHQKYVDPAFQNPMGDATPKKKAYKGVVNQTSAWHIHWNSSSELFACFSDIRGIRSTDGGGTWSFDYSGHELNTMYHIAAHPVHGTLYAATGSIHDLYMSHRLGDDPIDGGEGLLLSSTDGGVHWNVLHDFQHNVIWVEPDPTDPDRLFAGVVHSTEGGIYVTNDLQKGSASSWIKLADPSRSEGHPKIIRVLNDGTVVCTFSGRYASGFTAGSGVFVSTDLGASWEDRSDPAMMYWTQDLVVDPFDPSQNTWYVCVFSGWGGAANDLGGLYRTTDRGLSWNRLSDINRVYSCTFNPENRDQLFVTSEGDGLWFSDNIRDERPAFQPVD